MPHLLKSERLILRPMNHGDFTFLRSLHTDPEFMHFVGSGATRTEEQTQQTIDRSLAMEQENPAYGCWMVELAETHEPIGNLILRKPATVEKNEGLEIGYSIAPAFAGKGYATEAAARVVKHIFDDLGEDRVIALIHPDHLVSRKVLERIGFQPAGTTNYVDASNGQIIPTDLLEILRPAKRS